MVKSCWKQPTRSLDSKMQQEVWFVTEYFVRQVRISFALGHDMDEVDRQQAPYNAAVHSARE